MQIWKPVSCVANCESNILQLSYFKSSMHLKKMDLTFRNLGSPLRFYLQVNKTIEIIKSSVLFKKMAVFTENTADLFD